MQAPVTRVLIVEPPGGDAEMIRAAFAPFGSAFDLSIAHTVRRARPLVEARSVDVVVAAERLKDGPCIDVVAGPKKGTTVLPLIVLAEGENVRAAVTALRAGVAEYQVRTDEAIGSLPLTVTRVVGEWRRLQAERNSALQGRRALSILDALELHEVLEHVEVEKAAYRQELAASIDNLVGPILTKLRARGGRLTPREIDTLADGLQAAIGGDIDEYRKNVDKLSVREHAICEYIRQGRTSKEIAEELGLSEQTIHKHRQSIRRKLQLDRRGINLATYLRAR